MTLIIGVDCINCDACRTVCPNKAISQGMEIYEINPNLCSECIGYFDVPQCQIACPVNCIEKNT